METINRVRQRYGLALWDHIKRLGKHREKNETEITGIFEVVDKVQTHVIYVLYSVIFPDVGEGAKPGVLAGRISTRPMLACLVKVNGKFLFTYSHRPLIGRWMTEVPRGWVNPRLAQVSPAEQVRDVLVRKLGQEFIDSLTPFAPVPLGDNYEDTGAKEDICPYYYLEATTALPIPSKVNEANKIVALDWSEMIDRAQRRTACQENTSKTALWEFEHSDCFNE
ncbi:MAG: hypothetical protein ABH846_01865 [Patescibacteria group bacterium]